MTLGFVEYTDATGTAKRAVVTAWRGGSPMKVRLTVHEQGAAFTDVDGVPQGVGPNTWRYPPPGVSG